MNTHEQATKGGTSASNAGADRLCPGRHQAQKGQPEIVSEAADFGTKVHAALADSGNQSLMQSLTAEQRDIFDAHREIEKKVLSQIFGGQPDTTTRVWRHERYWCKVPDLLKGNNNLFHTHSGEADFVMRRGKVAVVSDYKSLSGDVPESPRNEQLRDLAVMVWRTLVVDEVIVFINQPLATHSPELCKYTRAELEQAEKEMWERVRASNAPNAPRIAGDAQCKWCRAKAVCKEYAQWAAALLPEKESPFKLFMADWTPEHCSTVAEHLPRLKKLLDDAEDFLKSKLAADPESVPGYYLKDGNTRETINNPQELFNRFVEINGTLEQFMNCISVTKGKLEAGVRTVTGAKGKALKAQIEKLLEGITDAKQNSPSLARKEMQ